MLLSDSEGVKIEKESFQTWLEVLLFRYQVHCCW